ncbi:MAG: hypothetical protein K8F60_03760 [Melioribacteraceae bacterium]|nr:hypothetical protein [Melioribacteraceae bacterium]
MNNKFQIENNIKGDSMESALVSNNSASKLANISPASAVAIPIIDGLLNAYSNTLNYLAIKREYEYLTTKVLEESRIFQIKLKNEYKLQSKKLKNDFKKYTIVADQLTIQIKNLTKIRKALISNLSSILLNSVENETEGKFKLQAISEISGLIMNFEDRIKELNDSLLQLYKYGVPEIKEDKI